MEPNTSEMREKPSDKEDGFAWQDYLDATKSLEVPQIMFPHVELGLQSGIEIGMSLEVPRFLEPDNEPVYWVASVVMTCGPLLRLRYFGGDDRSLEFWCNLTKEAAHELGWCIKNNKRLEPPEFVLKHSPNCVEQLPEFMSNARSVPTEMLTGDGLSMTERIKQGTKVEASDVQHPYKLWPATIIENIGGRLLLRYDTPGSPVKDFWVFCTSERLHCNGFVKNADLKWFLEPPSSILESHSYEEWKSLTETVRPIQEIQNNLFNNIREHPRHDFKVGMKLEAISPTNRVEICPATVVKVFDEKYFLVQIDIYEDPARTEDLDSTNGDTWLCTADHPYIFPTEWTRKKNIRLTHPIGWISKSEEFDWEAYLLATKSEAAPESSFSERESALDAGFEVGMYLEAVDPENENTLCAAHITKVVDNLLWIKLDNYEDFRPEHIVSMHSLQIFPVGWCESNSYTLKPPKDFIEVCRKLRTPPKEAKKKNILDIPISEPRSSLWCPKIYFNYRCFTGPMISKGKLATLPKAVGPGPVTLVMREVLSMIVSVGYRSARILKVLQCDSKPDPGYHLEILKAKHKNNTYRASVAVITSGDMVPKFCRDICKKLMVCPNLFGPSFIPEDECPDRCHKVSKNKFTAPVANGRRGKPKGYTSILVQKPKPWKGGRRKKRGRWANKDKDKEKEKEAGVEVPEVGIPFPLLDSVKLDKADESVENFDDKPPLSEIDIMIQKGIEKSVKSDDFKNEPLSSNASDDSRSSFNDRKSKDSNVRSPSSESSKVRSKTGNASDTVRNGKRDRDWDTSVESEYSDTEAEYLRLQKKQRRPKTRKLDSNPLFWSVDDVFRYLRKTNDCKGIAHQVRQEEIDGLAFLLLNLPSLTQHMKLRMSSALKLCRHVEQVKVTFFLRHINEVEPEQYRIL
ncbi:scm-like with four MBT domains protein 1 [Neodiprion pinetum]|uniref:Scm-like with four MBT domains protein 1 n=1 Tax=Neodiprion lecontei TaxID=441921 RepID=A0A6J0C203_NEOLC|nr:scm-like with four MBT domains protein 1 [Neodiprion lecontei]XP_046480864.1 scm-like with four MBT domains protein 1 [Neodiprion pinetum]